MGITLERERSGIGLTEYFGSGHCNNEINDTLWGAIAGYTYRKPCGFYFNTEFNWSCGSADERERYVEDLPSRFIHSYLVYARAGYNFMWNRCFLFTPYGGAGYRYVLHDLRHSDLDFSHRDWFGLVGARIDWVYNPCFTIGLDSMFFIPFDSSIRIKNYSKSISTDEHTGYQIELPMKFILPCFCRSFAITFAPFYRRFVDGRSKQHTFDIETIQAPEFRYQEYGAKLYFGVMF